MNNIFEIKNGIRDFLDDRRQGYNQELKSYEALEILGDEHTDISILWGLKESLLNQKVAFLNWLVEVLD